MVKKWVVKHSGHKATYLRKEPNHDDSARNVLALVPNGELVAGEFVHLRRASREAGFIKVKHLEAQCGKSWRICNADKAPSTLLRRQPQEAHDSGNAGGYANEGEIVSGEFVFVTRTDKTSGYIRRKHLRAHASTSKSAPSPPHASPSQGAQRWVVMDSNHDGAWLRREPVSDRSAANIVRLIPNGDHVVGEFVRVRRASGDEGFIEFRYLEAQGPRSWRVNSGSPTSTTVLRKDPCGGNDESNALSLILNGELMEGEYVYIHHRGGKRTGYIKRCHLTAMAQIPAAPKVSK